MSNYEKLQLAMSVAMAAILALLIGRHADHAWQIAMLACANIACVAALMLYWLRPLTQQAAAPSGSPPPNIERSLGDVVSLIVFFACMGYLLVPEVSRALGGPLV